MNVEAIEATVQVAMTNYHFPPPQPHTQDYTYVAVNEEILKSKSRGQARLECGVWY